MVALLVLSLWRLRQNFCEIQACLHLKTKSKVGTLLFDFHRYLGVLIIVLNVFDA